MAIAMAATTTAAAPREAVGIFPDEASLRSAADALLIAGFDRSSLALLADQRLVEARLGHACESITELEDDPEVPTRHYVGIDSRVEGESAIVGGCVYAAAILAVGIVAAANGTTVEALIAAAIVGGIAGLIGYAVVRWLERRHSRHLVDQVRRGGIPLWVGASGPEQEQRAIDILQRHGASHVHSHEMAQTAYVMRGGVSYQLSFMRALGL
jgi:hypothetical protein